MSCNINTDHMRITDLGGGGMGGGAVKCPKDQGQTDRTAPKLRPVNSFNYITRFGNNNLEPGCFKERSNIIFKKKKEKKR